MNSAVPYHSCTFITKIFYNEQYIHEPEYETENDSSMTGCVILDETIVSKTLNCNAFSIQTFYLITSYLAMCSLS